MQPVPRRVNQLRRVAAGNGDVMGLGLGAVALVMGFWWLAATGSAPAYWTPWTPEWAWEAFSTMSDWPALAPGVLLITAGVAMTAWRRIPRTALLVALGILVAMVVLVTLAMCVALSRVA